MDYRLVIILLTFAQIQLPEAVKIQPKCEHTMIGEVAYRRHLIANIDGYPTNIVHDPRNGNIFFMLNKRNFTKGLHILIHGSLGVKKVPISDELTAQCVAVDVPNDTVYIGTNLGLVTFDDIKTQINADKLIGEEDVKEIFIDNENHMYIIAGSLHEVFRIKNGTVHMKRFERVPKAYQMVMDTKGNVFYEYIDGKLYFFSNDLFEPIQYKGFTRDLTHILDVYKDDAVVSVKGVIFRLSIRNAIPLKIGQLGMRVTGMKYESSGDILIGTKGKIFRYKLIKDNDPCPVMDYY